MWKKESFFFLAILFSPDLSPSAIHPQPLYKPRLHDKKPIELAAKAWNSERDNWRRRLKQQCAQPHWAAPSVLMVNVHVCVCAYLKSVCIYGVKGC